MAAAPQRPAASSGGGGSAPAKAAVSAASESVSLNVEEKLLVKMGRDGTLESLEVRGGLNMCVNRY